MSNFIPASKPITGTTGIKAAKKVDDPKFQKGVKILEAFAKKHKLEIETKMYNKKVLFVEISEKWRSKNRIPLAQAEKLMKELRELDLETKWGGFGAKPPAKKIINDITIYNRPVKLKWDHDRKAESRRFLEKSREPKPFHGGDKNIY
ncbi:MAG: hypothetical protein V3T21_06275 [Candidatus Margulisiibacteriota bacterium]